MIDNLAFLLLSLGFVGFLTLYMTAGVYKEYRKRRRMDIYSTISGGILPLGALGVYLFIMGIVGQLTWPLPGSYNILFFDPLVGLGIVLIGFAYSVRTGIPMHYVGLLSLLLGVMVIYYGVEGFSIGLTQAPMALLGLFISFGLTGIFAFPVSLILDLEPGRTSKHPKVWFLMLVLFWVFLFTASVLSYVIGALAVPGHLLTPP